MVRRATRVRGARHLGRNLARRLGHLW
jgi:hypothetical protein